MVGPEGRIGRRAWPAARNDARWRETYGDLLHSMETRRALPCATPRRRELDSSSPSGDAHQHHWHRTTIFCVGRRLGITGARVAGHLLGVIAISSSSEH